MLLYLDAPLPSQAVCKGLIDSWRGTVTEILSSTTAHLEDIHKKANTLLPKAAWMKRENWMSRRSRLSISQRPGGLPAADHQVGFLHPFQSLTVHNFYRDSSVWINGWKLAASCWPRYSSTPSDLFKDTGPVAVFAANGWLAHSSIVKSYNRICFTTEVGGNSRKTREGVRKTELN